MGFTSHTQLFNEVWPLISQTTREILPQCSPKENDQRSHHIECIALVEVCTRQTIPVVLKVGIKLLRCSHGPISHPLASMTLENMNLDNMTSENMTLDDMTHDQSYHYIEPIAVVEVCTRQTVSVILKVGVK